MKDKEVLRYVYIGILYMYEYYLVTTREEILSFATTGADLEGILLSEMPERERQILGYLTDKWNIKENKKKYKTQKQNLFKKIRFVVTRAGGGQRGQMGGR